MLGLLASEYAGYQNRITLLQQLIECGDVLLGREFICGLDNRISNSRSSVSPDVVNNLRLSESDDEVAATTTRLEPILSPIGSGGSPSSGSESSPSDSESESSSAESTSGPAPPSAPTPPNPQPAVPPCLSSWGLRNFAPPPAHPPDHADLSNVLADAKGKPSPISELSDSEASSPSPGARRRRSQANRVMSAASSDEEAPRSAPVRTQPSPSVTAAVPNSSQSTGVKRGRPPKVRTPEERPPKKKRGRPPKTRPPSPAPDSEPEPEPPQHNPLQGTKTHIFRKVFTQRNKDECGGKGGKGGKGKGGKGKGQVTIIEATAPESGVDDDDRRVRDRSAERRNEEAIARVSPPQEPETLTRKREAERIANERIQERVSIERPDHRRSADRIPERPTERTSNDRIPDRTDRFPDRQSSDRLPPDRLSTDRLQDRLSNDRLSSDRSSDRSSLSSSERKSIDRLSGDKLLLERIQNDKLSVERIPSEKLDRLTSDKLSHDRSSSDKISHERLSSDKLSHDRLSIEKLSHERLSSEKIGHDRLSTDKIGHDRLLSDKIGHDRLSNDKIGHDRLLSDKIGHDRLSNDKVGHDRILADKLGHERLTSEKIGHERLASDKLSIERLPGDKLPLERVERIATERYIRAEADVGFVQTLSSGGERVSRGRPSCTVRIPLSRLRPDTLRLLQRPARRAKPPPPTPPTPPTDHSLEGGGSALERRGERTPIYYSYFERLPADALSDEERDHKYYLTEAKRLRTAAEREQEPLARVMLYLESVLCFVLTGRVLELELDTKRAFTIYRETIEYIKSIHSMPQRFRASPHSTFSKLDILSLRVQALLYLRMFKMYNREVKEYNKIVQEYQQKPACAEAVAGGAAGVSARSASPMSPSPSPAGSVGSGSGSGSSGYCSLPHAPGAAPAPPYCGLAHAVPAHAHNALLQLTKYYTFLYVAHDLWEQADCLCRLRANQDLFIAVDRKCGPLTLFSTFRHLVQYVRHAISLLKNAPRE
ncbi:AF4/FMR2 family member lilli isoform X3 [Maniola jurtina]|uniref:AF4/FMR2 family member lilli isoform X3 n=1 Tax=Maniola jurtina TaxID=191418 RepID=UPI001E6871AE|nr:AF4/FMR2 family member lilli isoform X3 [Maniola jurtina]